MNAFARKGLHDMIMHWLKICCWKGRSAQAILVRHHRQLKIKLLHNSGEGLEDSRKKNKLLKMINLIGWWRFFN